MHTLSEAVEGLGRMHAEEHEEPEGGDVAEGDVEATNEQDTQETPDDDDGDAD